MIRTKLLRLALAASFIPSAQAQIVSWVENHPRMLTRIGLWNRAAQQISGQFSIQYGTPVWKGEYNGMAEKAKHKNH